jgi:hypothetical protein
MRLKERGVADTRLVPVNSTCRVLSRRRQIIAKERLQHLENVSPRLPNTKIGVKSPHAAILLWKSAEMIAKGTKKNMSRVKATEKFAFLI